MNTGPFRILFAAAALLLAFAAAAGAQLPPPREGADTPREPRSRGVGGGGLLSRLNLTPEQRAQIRDIRRQTEQTGRPLLRRLGRARLALEEAVYSDTADDSLVQERLREFAAAQAEATRLRVLTELRIRRVLTPDQLSTLRELRRQAQLAQRRRQRARRLLRQRPDARPRPAEPDTEEDDGDTSLPPSLERRRRP